MLSVSRAGCDKRGSLAAFGIYLPSLSVCLSLSPSLSLSLYLSLRHRGQTTA